MMDYQIRLREEKRVEELRDNYKRAKELFRIAEYELLEELDEIIGRLSKIYRRTQDILYQTPESLRLDEVMRSFIRDKDNKNITKEILVEARKAYESIPEYKVYWDAKESWEEANEEKYKIAWPDY